MTTSTNPSARDRILATASELFYRQGIRAVGIDTIIAAAEVAKMTLYRHFPSKDDLIAAYLEDHNRRYWEWFEASISRHPDSPREQLLDLFNALDHKLSEPAYRGCPFQNTTTEFPDPAHPGHAVAREHKRELRIRLKRLAESAGARHADDLADQLLLLIEGVYSSEATLGADGPARCAKAAAAILLSAQLS